MLSFEDVRRIFLSYPQLEEKVSSNGRYSYQLKQSLQQGKEVAREIVCNKNGSWNGYVNAKYMQANTMKKYSGYVDPRQMIKIKSFRQDQLREVIEDTIHSMNNKALLPHTEISDEQKEIIPSHTPLLQKSNYSKSFEFLVRSCLYNWLGYGNPNGHVWFIGIEEGGAEIWRQQTKTLEESLLLRSKFGLHMNFHEVWENQFGITLTTFRGATVWNFIGAFLLTLKDQQATPLNIHNYIFEQKLLGCTDGEHYLCEFYPLPKPSKNDINPYQSIWRSISDYHNELQRKRFDLIRETLLNHPHVKMVVSYEQSLVELLKQDFTDSVIQLKNWKYGKQRYALFQIKLASERTVLLLSTPFFGQGQISYAGIADCVKQIEGFLP